MVWKGNNLEQGEELLRLLHAAGWRRGIESTKDRRSALADWVAAQRQYHRLIAEDAYFRWVDRGQPFGDPWTDWFAAEDAIARGRTARGPLSDALVYERLLYELIAEDAYLRWVDRGQPFGDQWTDWFAAEAEIKGTANPPRH